MKIDCLIVGAGFAGAVCAERLAAAGKHVLLIDKRSHLGGNAYDGYDKNGVLVHHYGPHIFHTNSKMIFDYLSLFTEWNDYQHRVKVCLDGKLYPFPINRDTLNQLYGLGLHSDKDVENYLASVREKTGPILTSEDKVVSMVGRDLYEKFFLGYTKKQWGLAPADLDASVAARIPYRTDHEERYFTDSFQGLPAHGYTKMFQSMLTHENIDIRMGIDYFAIKHSIVAEHTIYTGPIDEYFDYCYGRLPYRSLRFKHEHHSERDQYQVVGTVNYPGQQNYTRITEFKHMTGQMCKGTSIVKEFPCTEGDPYYPIPREENKRLYKRYQALAEEQTETSFVGRLAQYQYYNMDQVVAASMTAVKKLLENTK